MICKNAVEGILAERNILITARNPFVVSKAQAILFNESCILVTSLMDVHYLMVNRSGSITRSHAKKISTW